MVSATDQSARLRLRTHGLRPGRIQSAGDDRSVFGWAFRPRHRSASTTASDFKADLASSKLRYGPNSRVTFPLQKQAAIGVFRDARLCRYLRDRYPMLDVSTTLQGCGPARLPCGFQPAHRVIGDCERPRSGPGSCSGPTRDHDAKRWRTYASRVGLSRADFWAFCEGLAAANSSTAGMARDSDLNMHFLL